MIGLWLALAASALSVFVIWLVVINPQLMATRDSIVSNRLSFDNLLNLIIMFFLVQLNSFG
jgi:hypothetical protein